MSPSDTTETSPPPTSEPTDQQSEQAPSVQSEATESNSGLSEESDRSMTEFYQLQRNLYLLMLGVTVLMFVFVWLSYSGQTAFNYLLGACAGLLYFRRLARDIEGLGRQRLGFGSVRLAIFVVVMIVATQLERLAILPVFLGFMTYKAAIIVYVVQTTLFPTRE